MNYLADEDAEEFVDKVAAQLGEHFDSVQVLVSTCNGGGGTCDVFSGNGNWYARVGMAHEFIRRSTAQVDAKEIADALSIEDDY